MKSLLLALLLVPFLGMTQSKNTQYVYNPVKRVDTVKVLLMCFDRGSETSPDALTPLEVKGYVVVSLNSSKVEGLTFLNQNMQPLEEKFMVVNITPYFRKTNYLSSSPESYW